MSLGDPTVTIVDIETHCLGLDRMQARLDEMIAAFDDMAPPIRKIEDDMYAHTAEWMSSSGDGSYAPLEESTIRNKIRMGYPDAGKPLFASGALFESASTPVGPYSVHDVARTEGFIAVDWERDGWNIAALHQYGVGEELVTQHRHRTLKDGTREEYTVTFPWHLPARPIFTITDALVSLGADQIVDHIFQP
jgi:hypothetical protein